MRYVSRGASVAAICLVVAAVTVPATGRSVSPVLESGIVGSQPTDPLIAGARPGGFPWVASPRSKVEVNQDGKIEARVRGLVIPTAPFNGTNPVPTLSASLSCGGAIVASTEAVPFSAAGNADIEDEVSIPDRCLAPAVLFHPNVATAVWIGVSGG